MYYSNSIIAQRIISLLTVLAIFVSSIFCTTGMMVNAASATVTYTGTVTASSLNVRDSASSSGKIIGRLSKGTKVTIVEKGTSWHKIKYNSGYGYVASRYINNLKKVESTSATVIYTGTVTASSLNVRSSASSSGKIIGSLKKKSTVKIVDSLSGWYKIIYGNGYGYVSSDYVTISKADYVDNVTNEEKEESQSNTQNNSTNVIKYKTNYNYIDKGSYLNLGFSNAGNVKYSSSDYVNCPISASGVITGKKEGLYEITATNGNSSTTTYAVVLREPYSNIPAMSISTKGVKFISGWEGGGTVINTGETVFYPYQDVAGYWTLGYGHAKTSSASKSWTEKQAIEEFNKDITKLIGSVHILTDAKPYLTKAEAESLLACDLKTYTTAVSNWAIRNGVKLTQNQFDALSSFCYNLGTSYWTNDSNKFYLKSAIISHRSGSNANPDQIIEGFCRYIKSGGKNYKGLWYRRRNEAEMFITGDYAIDRSNKFTPPSNISWA